VKIQIQIAQQVREVFFGDNWTDSSLKPQLEDVSWQEAVYRIDGFNTIVGLVYHIGYFVTAVLSVLEGRTLNSRDSDSFDHPPVRKQADWEMLLSNTWKEAETLAARVEQLDSNRLEETFVEEKYGTYYRNIQGVVEHTHYHLGQIVLLKKIIRQKQNELPGLNLD